MKENSKQIHFESKVITKDETHNNTIDEVPLGTRTIQFIFSLTGIYSLYLYYGIMQEYIFSHDYGHGKTEKKIKFSYAFILVFFQSFLTYFFAAILIKFNNRLSMKEHLKLGLFNTVSMLGSNTALNYVSYPVQALMKSCKILSVILVTFVIGGHKHSRTEVFCAILISTGIFIFNLQGKSKGTDISSSYLGVAILLVSLFSDGMLADQQHDIQKKHHENFGTCHIMSGTNLFTFIFSFLYGMITFQFFGFIQFCAEYPAVMYDIFQITILGCAGQYFIFYTINKLGPITLSILTTTRKFFTVISSIFYFNHMITNFQWISIVLVFIGVVIELVHKVEGKLRKIKSN